MRRVAILGRTQFLLETAKLIHKSGFEISAIVTAKAEPFYSAKEEDFAAYSEEIQVPFYRGIRDPETQRKLRESNIDIAISVNWPFLLSDQEIGLFSKGILNGHIGDLPQYRGNACPNWAMIQGETSVGITVHFMRGGELDSGDIVVKKHLDINEDTYIAELYEQSEALFPYMFVEALQNLAKPDFKPISQASLDMPILRAYPRRPSDSLILWDRSAEEIHRLIRASSKPFDGAFCYLEHKQKVNIFRASLYDLGYKFLAVPGQVLESVDGMPVIACGSGCLLIEEASFEDKQDAMPAITKSLRNRLTSWQ